ncbi:MAG: mechanosensitive ion channel [Pseudomonadota bacterium]|nr:MAG: mechanosensitive ion channel [Pseudomonadota bacterium]
MDSLLKDPAALIDSHVIPWGVNILGAALVFLIGLWVAKLIVKGAKRLMDKANLEQVLIGFLGNMLYTVLLVVVIIAALEQLGVRTTSLLAVFATAGLAVGLALKDQLSNFAAGVMLIIFKPFTIGNFIEAGGTAGVVDTIRIFNTVLHTPDNREITVPNAQIFGGTITNVSARETRRIDLVIGIGYDDDIGKARDTLNSLIGADDRILEDPAPAIAVAELGESSIDLAVRPWVKAADFWNVRSDLLEGIKREFDSNGISIPFPQRDLHVYEQAANA